MGANRVLFTTPRTGSTPIFARLAAARELSGAWCPGEYFNQRGYSLDFLGGPEGTRLRLREPDEIRELQRQSPETERAEGLARLTFLRGASRNRAWFIKLLPSQLQAGVEEALAEWNWIVLRRRDRWEQLLSYLVSAATGVWYARDGGPLRVAPGSLRARARDFEDFDRDHAAFESACARLLAGGRRIVTIHYEDTMAAPQGLGPATGLTLPPGDWITSRQNPGDKLAAFENAAEIRAWFERSPWSRPV